MISDRARRLVEALHEPFSNEKRWEIADGLLLEERYEGYREGCAVGRKYPDARDWPCGCWIKDGPGMPVVVKTCSEHGTRGFDGEAEG